MKQRGDNVPRKDREVSEMAVSLLDFKTSEVRERWRTDTYENENDRGKRKGREGGRGRSLECLKGNVLGSSSVHCGQDQAGADLMEKLLL